jgi:tricorn protease
MSASGDIQAITSDRYNSSNPVWSSDGKWLYFLSDRTAKDNRDLTLGGAPT